MVPRGVLSALLVAAVAADAATEPWIEVGGERRSFTRVEQLLREPRLRVVAVEHRPKSPHASTLKLTLEGGVRLKFRVSDDLRRSRRNEDPKLFAASYEVSKLVFPSGGPVLPAVLRSLPFADLLPHLDDEARERLRPWASGGRLWGALCALETGGVRAQESRFFGGHVLPDTSRDTSGLPLGYLRSLGNLNVIATLTHNGDLHGDNWEIRESDGACFIVDSGISFTHDGVLPYQTRWRQPCAPLVPAYAASTIDRVAFLARSPALVHGVLARLQGTPYGLSAEARRVVLSQARRLVSCWEEASTLEVRSWELEGLVRNGEVSPLRKRGREALFVVADW